MWVSGLRLRSRGPSCVLISALAALALSGCPGPADLENAGDHAAPAGAVVGKPECETDCILSLFKSTSATGCGTCHTATAGPFFSSLDLVSPGPSARLLDVPARHESDPPLTGCPSGDKLIDSSRPESSWLLKKILGQHDGCGTQMPTTLLAGAELECMQTFVSCVAKPAP